MPAPSTAHDSFHIRRAECLVYRAPLDVPVQTSFGLMRDRPMVVARVEDQDGAVGWGEIWCNFPTVGAEHRARLVRSVLAPILCERLFGSPQEAFDVLTERTAVLAIQCAEAGPFAQAIAGLDLALWDLVARKADAPLWQYLGGTKPGIPVYASGLNPTAPEALAAQKFAEGFKAFKLKIGFGMDRDLANLAAIRKEVGPDARLMVDANQAWSPDEAMQAIPALEDHDLDWLEEPLRADRPASDWQRLRRHTKIPLAAGENLAGDAAFAAAITGGTLDVVQPDIAKWGGLSRCVPIARAIITAGLRYCPHYLGGGLGLLASAHALAAVGGNGVLEIDANPNPLRSELCGTLSVVVDGRATLTDAPGLGVVPDLNALTPFRVEF